MKRNKTINQNPIAQHKCLLTYLIVPRFHYRYYSLAEDLFCYIHAQLLSRVWLVAIPWDYSPPGSSVHRISQARILEWVAISSSRGSSWPRDRTRISCIGKWILYHCRTWEVFYCKYVSKMIPINTKIFDTESIVKDQIDPSSHLFIQWTDINIYLLLCAKNHA